MAAIASSSSFGSMTATAGPRARVQANVQRSLAAGSKPGQAGDNDPTTHLAPGFFRVRSHVEPSLTAGKYDIDVHHEISSPPDSSLKLTSHQSFFVKGPRFSISPDAVHQIYPPQGHGDEARILPHLVLEDWMLPWEQEPALSSCAEKNVPSGSGADGRRRVPWLALMSFEEAEIGLTDDEMAALDLVKAPSPLPKQNKTTLGVNLLLSDALKSSERVSKTASPSWVCPNLVDVTTAADDPVDESQRVDMIFVKRRVFQRMFSSEDTAHGSIVTPSDELPDVSRYAYMAHVREINTAQTADAGVQDQGKFSILISPRSGPILQPTDEPREIKVHLVSLLGLSSGNIKMQTGTDVVVDDSKKLEQRIGMISLFSWSYTCLPPGKVDSLQKMQQLGRQLDPALNAEASVGSLISPAIAQLQGTKGWLRSDAVWQLNSGDSKNGNGTATGSIAERMFYGFDLARYQTITGESTAAWIKGPLGPTITEHPLPTLPPQVNSSMGLAQLDGSLGILDLTYASAWELGHTLAIADRAFTAALVRLRRSVHEISTHKTLMATSPKGVENQVVLTSLQGVIEALQNLPAEIPNVQDGGTRMSLPTNFTQHTTAGGPLALPQVLPRSRETFRSFVQSTVKDLASAVDKSKPETPRLYNEYNVPHSPDWALVLKWVIDRLYLYNIPAHYLIGDPSRLPTESIRFFHIDSNWTDALIDGALSLGNHYDRDQDEVRMAIKREMNTYLRTPIDSDKHPFAPQIPSFGFLLRSDLVQAVPNLEVHAPWQTKDDTRAHDPRSETLRLERLAPDVLLCLLDRLPGSPDYPQGIRLQPPHHQQRFAAGVDLGPRQQQSMAPTPVPAQPDNAITLGVRTMYDDTTGAPPALGSDPGPWAVFQHLTWLEHPSAADPPQSHPLVYDFESRAILPQTYARVCRDTISSAMPAAKLLDDSALLAFQLNDPNLFLQIALDAASSDPNNPPAPVRQFPLPPPIPASADGGPVSMKQSQDSAPLVTSAPQSRAPTTKFDSPFVGGRMLHRGKSGSGISASATLALAATSADPTDDDFQTPILPPSIWTTEAMAAFQATPTTGDGPMNQFDVKMTPADDGGLMPRVDLVFRLRPASSETQTRLQAKLLGASLVIMQGSQKTDLIRTYKGPGAHMLAGNLRWNIAVQAKTTGMGPALWITLLPRRTTEMCRIDKNMDVSFILYGAVLNGVGDVGNTYVSYVQYTERLEDTSGKIHNVQRELVMERRIIV